MSSFYRTTKHPETGEFQAAHWMDDHFGRYQYGVRFPDGKTYHASAIDVIEINGVDAETEGQQTNVRHWDGSEERNNEG